jgi:hypothetical protein
MAGAPEPDVTVGGESAARFTVRISLPAARRPTPGPPAASSQGRAGSAIPHARLHRVATPGRDASRIQLTVFVRRCHELAGSWKYN